MGAYRRSPLQQPLDSAALSRLALAYVARYATTRAKLQTYLTRKLCDRGWSGADAASVEAIAAQCVAAGYIDDEAFAETRSAVLARRGYGARRINADLAAAGVVPELASRFGHDRDAAFAAAEAFARRRRIGPFAHFAGDDKMRRRAFAAMLRAGHEFELARRFAEAAPGDFPDRENS